MSRRASTIPADPFLAELDPSEDATVALEALALEAAAAPALARSSRARLLASIRSTHRFDDLEAAVAAHLDLSGPDTAKLLLAIDDASPWDAGPRPGIQLFHVSGGPKVANAVTGFVRIERGVDFPEHEHLGDEVVLILQGACRDASGTVHRAGEEVRMRKGTRHHLTAIGDVRLIYLAVIQEGVVIDGVVMKAGDPGA